MTQFFHRAARTAAAAGGFSFFLISDHFNDDQSAYGENDEGDENGREILTKPIEHAITPLRIILLLQFLRDPYKVLQA